MKIRIRFSKTGALIYIGHLDVMRYFQKLFVRAALPVKYSEGFSPHQILSFTPPLPLGMESYGEYADLELTKSVDAEEALRTLSEHSVPEIGILSFKELPQKCTNAMASVAAAGYSLIFPDSESFGIIRKAADDFYGRNEVNIVKKTKKNESVINLRPLVYKIDTDEKSNTANILISSGSRDNIKPSHVLTALCDIAGRTVKTENIVISRLDQYTISEGKLISLDDIGL